MVLVSEMTLEVDLFIEQILAAEENERIRTFPKSSLFQLCLWDPRCTAKVALDLRFAVCAVVATVAFEYLGSREVLRS